MLEQACFVRWEGGLGLVVPILQGQVVTVVQPSGTNAILTDIPEKDAIGEETKAKTKEVSTRSRQPKKQERKDPKHQENNMTTTKERMTKRMRCVWCA